MASRFHKKSRSRKANKNARLPDTMIVNGEKFHKEHQKHVHTVKEAKNILYKCGKDKYPVLDEALKTIEIIKDDEKLQQDQKTQKIKAALNDAWKTYNRKDLRKSIHDWDKAHRLKLFFLAPKKYLTEALDGKEAETAEFERIKNTYFGTEDDQQNVASRTLVERYDAASKSLNALAESLGFGKKKGGKKDGKDPGKEQAEKE